MPAPDGSTVCARHRAIALSLCWRPYSSSPRACASVLLLAGRWDGIVGSAQRPTSLAWAALALACGSNEGAISSSRQMTPLKAALATKSAPVKTSAIRCFRRCATGDAPLSARSPSLPLARISARSVCWWVRRQTHGQGREGRTAGVGGYRCGVAGPADGAAQLADKLEGCDPGTCPRRVCDKTGAISMA
jgi:hypothetical protein